MNFVTEIQLKVVFIQKLFANIKRFQSLKGTAGRAARQQRGNFGTSTLFFIIFTKPYQPNVRAWIIQLWSYLWFEGFECGNVCAFSSLPARVKHSPPFGRTLLADFSMFFLQEIKNKYNSQYYYYYFTATLLCHISFTRTLGRKLLWQVLHRTRFRGGGASSPSAKKSRIKVCMDYFIFTF